MSQLIYTKYILKIEPHVLLSLMSIEMKSPHPHNQNIEPCNFEISSAKIDERLLPRKTLISFMTNRIQAAKRHSYQSSMRRTNYPIVQIFSKDPDFFEGEKI